VTTSPPRATESVPPALRRCRLVARAFDEAIRIPYTPIRIGIDPIIGVLPVAGDLLTGLASLYVVAEAARLGVPRVVLARMLLNVVLDVALGSVPVLGDLLDVAWRANSRNVALLEGHLDRPGSPE